MPLDDGGIDEELWRRTHTELDIREADERLRRIRKEERKQHLKEYEELVQWCANAYQDILDLRANMLNKIAPHTTNDVWGAEVRRVILQDGEYITDSHKLETWSVDIPVRENNSAADSHEALFRSIEQYEKDKVAKFCAKHKDAKPIVHELLSWQVLRDDTTKACSFKKNGIFFLTFVKYAIVLPQVPNPWAQASEEQIALAQLDSVNFSALTVNSEPLDCIESSDAAEAFLDGIRYAADYIREHCSTSVCRGDGVDFEYYVVPEARLKEILEEAAR